MASEYLTYWSSLNLKVRFTMKLRESEGTYACISDLVKYGYVAASPSIMHSYKTARSFIPEFISRVPTITTLSPLSPAELLRILTEVHGSLVSQYTALFGYSGVEIRFTSAALREICRKAAERGGGARGLRGIMVSLDSSFQIHF